MDTGVVVTSACEEHEVNHTARRSGEMHDRPTVRRSYPQVSDRGTPCRQSAERGCHERENAERHQAAHEILGRSTSRSPPCSTATVECRHRDSAFRAAGPVTRRRTRRRRHRGLECFRREESVDVDATNAREPLDENAIQVFDLFVRKHTRSGADFRCVGASAQNSAVPKCRSRPARLTGQANDAPDLGRPQVRPGVTQRTPDAGALPAELG